MSEDQRTYLDLLLLRIKKHRVGAIVMLAGIAVIGLGALAQAILHLSDLGERILGAPDKPPQTADSSDEDVLPDEVLFLEDFSNYEEGDDPGWGPNVTVKVRDDGRKWLAASVEGAHQAGQDISLPRDFCLEFDVSAQITGLVRRITDTSLNPISTEIRFVDDRGSPTEIACTFSGEGQSFTLPSGAKGAISGSDSTAGQESVFPKNQTIQRVARRTVGSLRIVREAGVLKLFAGDRLVASESLDATKKFARFELDVVKRGEEVPLGTDDYSQREEYVSFTAIRITEI